MKLQKIKTKKSTQSKVQNITHKLQGIKTVGYINLIARNKVQIDKVKGLPTVKIYKSKTGLKLGKLAIQAKTKLNRYANKIFNTSFVQVGIFEAKIEQAKKALKDAKKMYLTTLEYFNLHVNLAKAILHLRSFKYSLPRQIVNLLF